MSHQTQPQKLYHAENEIASPEIEPKCRPGHSSPCSAVTAIFRTKVLSTVCLAPKAGGKGWRWAAETLEGSSQGVAFQPHSPLSTC